MAPPLNLTGDFSLLYALLLSFSCRTKLKGYPRHSGVDYTLGYALSHKREKA